MNPTILTISGEMQDAGGYRQSASSDYGGRRTERSSVLSDIQKTVPLNVTLRDLDMKRLFHIN